MSTSDIIAVEPIQKADLEEIVLLGRATPELQVTEEPAYYPKEALERFITSPHDIYLKATIDGVLAGYQLATVNPYLKEAYLIDLVVKEEYRNLGIATKLLEETFARLQEKECGWAWGLVQEKNQHMMEFLKKRGFEKGVSFSFFYKLPPFV